MLKGVIFDADGTLLKSMEFWNSMVVDLIKSTGVTPDDKLIEILTPMSMLEGAEYIKREYNLPFSVQEIIKEENKVIENFYFNDVEMRGGTVELLKYLKNNHIPITVATATDKYLIIGALKHLDIIHYFKDAISCTDIGEGKTSPKIYIECCNIMNTVPVDTLVVEDSLSALTTAKNADFKTMAVFDSTQKRFWDKLKVLADYTVESDFIASHILSVF